MTGPAADRHVTDAITATVRDYYEGWFEGDAARMRRALHPDLVKRRLADTGAVVGVGAADMVEATQRGAGGRYPPERRRIRISVNHVHGSIADVHVTGDVYVDYLQLVETDGRWQILNALWAPASSAAVEAGPPGAPERAAVLLALHDGPGFVLPNAWDAGSARILEQLGFPAIATTSAGIAWSLGLPDGEALDRETMLDHVGRIVDAVGVPVTADLEAGYGDTPDEVGRTVARAVGLGVVGANIEDAGRAGLFGIDEAADRLAAARAAAPRGTFVLNARTDTYFAGTLGDTYAETLERAHRYLAAGADCVFVPGVVDAETIRRLAADVPGPLNVVAGLANTIDARTLFSLGVRRVSLGGSLARAALSLLERAGHELLDAGTLGFLDGAISYADLQRRFGAGGSGPAGPGDRR
jgi:2-methylisocitrate lyase-like PEP mutase family enzyme